MTTAGLPAAELHLHIEGTLEPELALTLARRNGITLSHDTADELRRRYAFEDLQSFLDIYYETMAVLREPQDFTDLADAYFERAAADGVVRAELFFDPQAHLRRGVPFDVVIDGLWTAVQSSEARFGVSSGLIMCFLRDLGPAAAMETLDAASGHVDRLLGVGLDSSEVGFPPGDFAEVFEAARAAGLHTVAHAGEEGPPSYIWDALDVLGVERVDHGVRCLEDDALVARLVADRIPLTVCPLSNLQLCVVPTMADHNLPRMLDAGLVVTVNSDDPAYFGGYLGANIAAVRDTFGLDDAALRLLAANSFEASFVDDDERARLLARLEATP